MPMLFLAGGGLPWHTPNFVKFHNSSKEAEKVLKVGVLSHQGIDYGKGLTGQGGSMIKLSGQLMALTAQAPAAGRSMSKVHFGDYGNNLYQILRGMKWRHGGE